MPPLEVTLYRPRHSRPQSKPRASVASTDAPSEDLGFDVNYAYHSDDEGKSPCFS